MTLSKIEPNELSTRHDAHKSAWQTEAEELRTRLGKTIAGMRSERELSQEVLAERCHIAQSYLCEIEHGTKNPTWETLVALCQALDISLAKLVITSELSARKLTPRQRQLLETVFSLFKTTP